MFPLIFCALCAQKFWRAHSLSGRSPRILRPKPKRCLCSKSGEDKKKVLKENERFLCPKTGEKKKDFTQNLSMFVLVMFIVATLIATYVCARIENV